MAARVSIGKLPSMRLALFSLLFVLAAVIFFLLHKRTSEKEGVQNCFAKVEKTYSLPLTAGYIRLDSSSTLFEYKGDQVRVYVTPGDTTHQIVCFVGDSSSVGFFIHLEPNRYPGMNLLDTVIKSRYVSCDQRQNTYVMERPDSNNKFVLTDSTFHPELGIYVYRADYSIKVFTGTGLDTGTLSGAIFNLRLPPTRSTVFAVH